MSKKRTHKKNKAVEGTKKRTQKSKSILANYNDFSDFKGFEFDAKDFNFDFGIDLDFDLDERIKQMKVPLFHPIEFVSLKGSKSVKKANKKTSRAKKVNSSEDNND